MSYNMRTGFAIFFIFMSVCTYCSESINFVEHKGSQLNLYLDFIKYNLEEKLGILPYILKNHQGVYLEVGAGGDPIAELMTKIPDTMSPTIIAADIDQDVLRSLPVRHPELKKFIDQSGQGPVLLLRQLDATCMNCFSDNSLDGINASAVVHEIVSYAGGVNGFAKFFTQALRILKPGGVFIYRDPESVFNKADLVTIDCKTPAARLFVHIFLFKFLDQTRGRLAASCRKSEKYNHDLITFTFYKKNEPFLCKATYEEYLALRSQDIDFSRRYTLTMPHGLCREIECHYVTYLKQCNPLMFVQCAPRLDTELCSVNYLAYIAQAVLDDFLSNNNCTMIDGFIDKATRSALRAAVVNATKVIECGIPLCFESSAQERKLWSLLKQYDFDPSRYLTPLKDHSYVLDYRVFGLLYDYMVEAVFDPANGPVHATDAVHAQWLKREGEESYTYYSVDELITSVAEISLANKALEREPFVLCPLSPDDNKFISRPCYEEVLKESFSVYDSAGFPLEIKEGKRIIHFAKMSLKAALAVYEDIIEREPGRYVLLREFVNNNLKTIIDL